LKNIKVYKIIKIIKRCTAFALVLISYIILRVMTNKKNWNTENFRRWENENLGISIPPDYTGKDIINVKPKSQHLHTKLKVFRRIG